MDKIISLRLEEIGHDLCLTIKTDGSRARSIAGRIEPALLRPIGAGFIAAARRYRQNDRPELHLDLMDNTELDRPAVPPHAVKPLSPAAGLALATAGFATLIWGVALPIAGLLAILGLPPFAAVP
jgi:hypothetical protein